MALSRAMSRFHRRRDLTAAILREQKAARGAGKGLQDDGGRFASAGDQLTLLVEKGEPTLARITVAAGLLTDLARLRSAGAAA